MRKTNQKKIYIALIFAAMLALTACGAEPTKDFEPSNTPTPTATPTSTPTPTPTSTPSPTPTQTPKDALLSALEKTANNALYARYGLSAATDTYVELETLGDKLLLHYVEGSSDIEETSDFVWTLIDPATNQIEGRIKLATRVEVIYSMIDDNHFIICDKDNSTYQIFDQDLNQINQFVLADCYILSEPLVDLEENKMYYLQDEGLFCYNYENREVKNIYEFQQEFYYNMGVENEYIRLEGYAFNEGPETEGCFLYIDATTGEPVKKDFECKRRFYNEDGSEYLLADIYDTAELSVYKTEGDQFVTKINLQSRAEIYGAYLIWNDRVVITKQDISLYPGYYEELRCYSVDTGEMISSCIVKTMNSWMDSPTCLTDKSLFVISDLKLTSVEKEDYFYEEEEKGFLYWDYLNDDIDNTEDLYDRQSNITQTFSDTVEKLRRKLEEKYAINVYLGYEVCPVDFSYGVEVCTNEQQIYSALKIIEKVFSSYPKGFFDQLKTNYIRTLGVYLCDGFIKTNEYSAENAIALAASSTYERTLALDVNYYDELEGTVYHEVSHWIDTIVTDAEYSGKVVNFAEGWSALNPENFEYLNRYTDYYGNLDYTPLWNQMEDAYFIDAYSTTYPGEDRARLFEYLMSDTTIEYWKSEHLIKKIEFYFNAIRAAFDTEQWPEKTSWELKLDEWKEMSQ